MKKLPRHLLALVDGIVDAGNAHGDIVHTRQLFYVQMLDEVYHQ